MSKIPAIANAVLKRIDVDGVKFYSVAVFEFRGDAKDYVHMLWDRGDRHDYYLRIGGDYEMIMRFEHYGKKKCEHEGCTNWTGLVNGLCNFHSQDGENV